jgi:hypothetical protein
MTEAGIDPPPGACSLSKSQYTSTVPRLSRADLRQSAMCFKMGVMPPGHPSLVHCMVTMNKNMEKRLLHSVPTEMAVDRGILPPPFKVIKGEQCDNAGIQSEIQNTTRKVPHV